MNNLVDIFMHFRTYFAERQQILTDDRSLSDKNISRFVLSVLEETSALLALALASGQLRTFVPKLKLKKTKSI